MPGTFASSLARANAILNSTRGGGERERKRESERTSPLSTMSDRWTGSHLAEHCDEIYETFHPAARHGIIIGNSSVLTDDLPPPRERAQS